MSLMMRIGFGSNKEVQMNADLIMLQAITILWAPGVFLFGIWYVWDMCSRGN
jgi:hypothetical protein